MLVDDQQVVLWAIQKLISEHQPQLEVVATVSSGSQILTQARGSQPDVIVLEPNIDAGAGAKLLVQLREENTCRVLLYTTEISDAALDRAMLDGAHGLVRKDVDPQQLIHAIRKVHEGEVWVDRKTSSRLLAEMSQGTRRTRSGARQSKLDLLTPREFGILEVMATMPGSRNKQIADHLGISENTLRNHLSAIFEKLGVRSRYELFSYASKRLSGARQTPSTWGGLK